MMNNNSHQILVRRCVEGETQRRVHYTDATTHAKSNFVNYNNKVTTSAGPQVPSKSTLTDNNHYHLNNAPESMSTTSTETNNTRALRVSANRRTVSESSAEEFTKNTTETLTDMWRNELTVNSASVAAQPDRRRVRGTGGGDSICASSRNTQIVSNFLDVVIRIAIVIIFVKLEVMTPFKRDIHIEELWLYKHPRTPDIVSPVELLVAVIVAPFGISLLHYMYTKDKQDFRSASWAWTLALCMNAIPTTLLKITVGRPRPDFYYRCFPDGIMVLNNTTDNAMSLDFNCTGKLSDVNEGRKSFPSGHSSFAFASFGFIAFYIGAKLHAFNARGRGQTWRLCIAVQPLLLAAMVAVSRTCDYHHHWQDVTIGALIGLIAGYVSYRQYYPSIFARDCNCPLMRWPKRQQLYACMESDSEVDNSDERRRLLNSTSIGKQQSKWY